MTVWLTKILDSMVNDRRENSRNSESGVFLAFVSLIAFFLIALVALAVDLSWAAQTRLKLRYVVDNTILNAPIYVLTNSYDKTEVRKRLEDMTRTNLDLDGFDPSAILSVNFDVQDQTITASASLRRTLALTNGIVAPFSSLDLTVNSRLQIPRVNLIVLLDRSRSMGQPDELKPTQTKLISALGGLAELARWLREPIDRVAVIAYSDFATKLVSFQPGGGYSIAAVSSAVGGLGVKSWSNLNDALRLGIAEFASIPFEANAVNILAVYSDMRVNAGLFRFATGVAPGLNNSLYYVFPSRMYSWANDSTIADLEVRHRVEGYTLREFPLSGPSAWLTRKPACEISTWGTVVTAGISLEVNSDIPDLTACINSLTLQGTYKGLIYPGLPVQPRYFNQQMYNLAIDQADTLRNNRITVFNVLIGSSQSGPPQIYDAPFFTMGNDAFTGNFLNRFTLSAASITSVNFPPLAVFPASSLVSGVMRDYKGESYQANSVGLSTLEAQRMLFGRVNFDLEY